MFWETVEVCVNFRESNGLASSRASVTAEEFQQSAKPELNPVTEVSIGCKEFCVR